MKYLIFMIVGFISMIYGAYMNPMNYIYNFKGAFEPIIYLYIFCVLSGAFLVGYSFAKLNPEVEL